MTGIAPSMRAYEDWLRARLGGRFVAEDLTHKHTLMGKGAFAFLRGTCFRWGETAPAERRRQQLRPRLRR